MLAILTHLSASYERYGVTINELLDSAVTENFNFYECQFTGIGTLTTPSTINLYRGSANCGVNMVACVFSFCQAKDGGAFSLWDYMDCNVKLICAYGCKAANSGGCCVIKLASSFNASHISAVSCESACKNFFFSGVHLSQT